MVQQQVDVFPWKNTFKKFLINYPNLLLLFYINYKLIKLLDQYFPWDIKQYIPLRLLTELVLASLTISLQVLLVNVVIALLVEEELMLSKLLFSAVVGIVVNLILVPTMEFYFQYTRRYEVALDNQWLKKENARFQYELLKNQLNPHFLFNSLNTLSSLISIDAVRAKSFVRKLSQVYRHILEHREKELITLRDEMKFIEGYVFLLKTRFGEGLQMNIKIAAADMNKKIVPMALQKLNENVVKHNAVLEGAPLVIHICSQNEEIIITNNIQRKQSTSSWGIGLKSISNSYKRQQKSINIVKNPQFFQVALPLL
ncbi:MAG: sensor histidine kinase [Thermonemataceae bacterium]